MEILGIIISIGLIFVCFSLIDSIILGAVYLHDIHINRNPYEVHKCKINIWIASILLVITISLITLVSIYTLKIRDKNTIEQYKENIELLNEFSNNR